MTAVPAAIRGKGKSSSSGTVQVAKQLGELIVTVEVEKTEGQFCQVTVNVRPLGRAFADGLRISLLSGDREQASYLARQGSATFERIPPGEYQLALTDSGNSLGAICLTIKEDGRE